MSTTIQIDTNKKTESYSDFKEWYQNWDKAKSGYKHSRISSWFEAVQDYHKEIRDIIGGVSKTDDIVLEKQQLNADEAECKPYIDAILHRLPCILVDLKINKTNFLQPYLPNKTKVGKAIMQYCKNMYSYVSYKSIVDQVADNVAKLGEIVAKTKIADQELFTTLTTSAKAFLMLGHYGPDNKSCFSNTGSNSQHKWILATLPNSFILLIKSELTEEDEPENSDAVMARLWGFYSDNMVSFCNYYPRGRISEAMTKAVCKLLAGDILETDSDNLSMSNNIIKVSSNVYHNGHKDQNWTFYTGSEIPKEHSLNKY